MTFENSLCPSFSLHFSTILIGVSATSGIVELMDSIKLASWYLTLNSRHEMSHGLISDRIFEDLKLLMS